MTTPVRMLAEKIRETGFTCLRCGECCRQGEPGSDLVMVTPPEIHAIMEATGLERNKLVEPFPEVLTREGDGVRYTFEWALKRKDGRCSFQSSRSCSIYECRPWICRTYPFWLHQGGLGIAPCPGIGGEIDYDEACRIATTLLERQNAEIAEEHMIKELLKTHPLPTGGVAVIDSEGIRVIHE